VSTDQIDRAAVAMVLGEPLGDAVIDGQAELDPVHVPGMESTVVWRVRDESADHPWQVYVGRWPNGDVRVLTDDQDAWADLVAATGVHLADAGQALAYVESYLEVTRGAMVIVLPIRSLDELRWRPGSPDEEEAKTHLLAAPPDVERVAEAKGKGFHVALTLVVDQRLQRNEFEIAADGQVLKSSFEVLAERLPLPIAR